jgi:SAM-dependent methyltransferase
MSGFPADWLKLREPYDLRARNPKVLEAVIAFLKSRPSVQIADLACGTGSTLRALSPSLSARQSWKLFDNDIDLLTRATAGPRGKDVAVTAMPFDLSRNIAAALDGAIDLVTVSALLDLVSDRWLEEFAEALAARSLPLYAALSYDGRTGLTPPDTLDAAIVRAMNSHQRTDKGFGPALGPAAAASAIARLEGLGYSIVQGTSDWEMGPDDREMQTEILTGWASATQEMGSFSSTETADWLTRRRNAVSAGRASLCVGHVDFLAVPRAMR